MYREIQKLPQPDRLKRERHISQNTYIPLSEYNINLDKVCGDGARPVNWAGRYPKIAPIVEQLQYLRYIREPLDDISAEDDFSGKPADRLQQCLRRVDEKSEVVSRLPHSGFGLFLWRIQKFLIGLVTKPSVAAEFMMPRGKSMVQSLGFFKREPEKMDGSESMRADTVNPQSDGQFLVHEGDEGVADYVEESEMAKLSS